jgi:hypothetical protein
MRSRTSSLTGPFPSSSSLLSPSGSLTVRACLRWKTACLSGLAAAGLGLFCAQLMSHLWMRESIRSRPTHRRRFSSRRRRRSPRSRVTTRSPSSRLRSRWRWSGDAEPVCSFSRPPPSSSLASSWGRHRGRGAHRLDRCARVFSPGPNRWSPVVATLSRLTDPLVAPVGKRSTPRKGLARSTRTGACFG